MLHNRVAAIAAEPVPTGVYVRLEGERAFVDHSLIGPGGVAVAAPGETRVDLIPEGAPLSVVTDGGVQARLLADAEIKLGGRVIRLLAIDQHYLHLADGRVIGFLGDARLTA